MPEGLWIPKRKCVLNILRPMGAITAEHKEQRLNRLAILSSESKINVSMYRF